MNPEFEILAQGFKYDLWANSKWWAYVEENGLGEPERQIFRHMLGAQDIWYQRCLGGAPTAFPEFEATAEKIVELHGQWMHVLQTRSDNPIIHYRSLDGTPYHMHVSKIARHVIDHGTYHRGELRGLCRGRDATDFPETGLAYFYLTPGLAD
jgi:uncharacterized damage-inducible protein DinB